MKVFIVFAALIAVAASSAIRSSGWGAPPASSIDLELAAAAAAAAQGSASASQQLLELVSGNAAGPASLSSSSGVLAVVSQDEDIAQVAVANVPDGSTSTINVVDVENNATGLDSLNAALSGANGASVQNAGASDATGEGALAAEAESLNNVQQKKRQ